jgi:alkanesulfonate monooxygenase SsuD/methylene tetrahydromethanopterin reductase-like flavin-dependent oxidoreductase (luciferase family)
VSEAKDEGRGAFNPVVIALMGGDGATTFDRVIEFCDGWMPIGYRMTNVADRIAGLHSRAEAAGRDPKTISISIFGANPDPAALAAFESAGVERAIFMVPPAERDAVLPMLDKYAALIG